MNMDSITKTDAGYQVFFVKDDFALTHIYKTHKEALRWLNHWAAMCMFTNPEQAYKLTILDSFYWRD